MTRLAYDPRTLGWVELKACEDGEILAWHHGLNSHLAVDAPIVVIGHRKSDIPYCTVTAPVAGILRMRWQQRKVKEGQLIGYIEPAPAAETTYPEPEERWHRPEPAAEPEPLPDPYPFVEHLRYELDGEQTQLNQRIDARLIELFNREREAKSLKAGDMLAVILHSFFMLADKERKFAVEHYERYHGVTFAPPPQKKDSLKVAPSRKKSG